MNSKMKTLLGIGIFTLFIAIAGFAYNTLSERFKPETPFELADEEASIEEKQLMAAPDFTVFDDEGKEVKLSDYFGKPIVLNFWASWCPPCKSEMPHFNKVYNELKDEIVFLMVDLVDGQKETEEKGKKYIANNGFTFPVLYDLEQDAAYTYGIRSIPTTIFINKDGDIVTGAEGAINEDILLKGIEYCK